MSVRPVNIQPVDPSLQRIKPTPASISGGNPAPSRFLRGNNGINNSGSRVYDRMNSVQDSKARRMEYLEDQARIRGQKLEDDVTRRNQQVDDIDRTRIEQMSDDERDYGRDKWKRDAEKQKNKEFFKTLELNRKEARRKAKDLKSENLLLAQGNLQKLYNTEFSSEKTTELRSMYMGELNRMGKERDSLKSEMREDIIVEAGTILQGGLDGEDEILDTIASRFGERKRFKDLTHKEKHILADDLCAKALGGSNSIFLGKVAQQVKDIVEDKKIIDERMTKYMDMLSRLDRESSPKAIKGMEEVLRKRIVSLGGNPDLFAEEEESVSTEKEKTPPVAEGGKKKKGYFTEDEEAKMDISQARQNIEDIEKDRSSITGSALQKISDGASNLNEGIKNLGGYGEVAKEGLATAVENPGATITAGYLAKKGGEAAIRGGKSMVASNNSAKKAEKILEMIEADDFFKNYDKDFLSKNGVKPYPKPKPTVTGMGGAGVKEYVEWKQGFDKHIDAEVASKTKTFIGRTRKLLDKAKGNKLLKTLGLIGVGAEVISIGKDLSQALGFYVPDELKAAQHELYKLQQLQKTSLENTKRVGEVAIEASKDDNSTEVDSNATQVDNISPDANLIKPEANATAPMPEANATAPSASVIKPEQPAAPTSMPSRDNTSDQPQPDIVTSQMSKLLGQQFDSSNIALDDFKGDGVNYGFGYRDFPEAGGVGGFYYSGRVSPDGKIISLKRIPIDEYGRPGDQHEKLL